MSEKNDTTVYARMLNRRRFLGKAALGSSKPAVEKQIASSFFSFRLVINVLSLGIGIFILNMIFFELWGLSALPPDGGREYLT
jgi:hypothetical protein